MTTAMPFTLNAPRPQALVPGSGRKGEPKALRSSPEELKVCVEHAATFTWQRMAGQVRSLIEDCVKGRTARS